MNPCTIAIWKCQNTGLLAEGVLYEGRMWIYNKGGVMENIDIRSYDPAAWDYWSAL